MEVPCFFLPETKNLQIKSWLVDSIKAHVTLIISSIKTDVTCPVCTRSALKVHSYYKRTLADVPIADYTLTLELRVRKFFCGNGACSRRIFTERLIGIAEPWARRTLRLSQRLTAIALSLGGAAGVKLLPHLDYVVSRNTLLSLVRKIPLPPIVTPKTLGVDDFSFRKRQTYGTVLIDLERSRPIAILKDREAETLAAWLKAHPGVEVVSRDRSKAYEKGVLQGAPLAIQVADRFHLLQNLAETLTQVFNAHTKAIKTAATTHSVSSVNCTDGATVVPMLPPSLTGKEQCKAEQRRARRLANYQQVWELHNQGSSAYAIARQLGLGRGTVFRYLSCSEFPERKGRSDCGRSLLDPFKNYLLERWNQGCHDTKGMFEEIQKHGYIGSYDTVARYTRRLRQSQGVKLRQRHFKKPLPIVTEPSKRSLTPSRATWLVMRQVDSQESEDKQLIALLKAQHPDLADAIELATSFAQIVRQRQPLELDCWLEKALESNLSPFQRFATGLRSDYDAVKAGVTLPTSNGPVEGHINRLKMLKRQMYGRASLDLLTRRFLLAF